MSLIEYLYYCNIFFFADLYHSWSIGFDLGGFAVLDENAIRLI